MQRYPSINCCLLSFPDLLRPNISKTLVAKKSSVILSSTFVASVFLKKKDNSILANNVTVKIRAKLLPL